MDKMEQAKVLMAMGKGLCDGLTLEDKKEIVEQCLDETMTGVVYNFRKEYDKQVHVAAKMFSITEDEAKVIADKVVGKINEAYDKFREITPDPLIELADELFE
jgi:ribosome recycling factor